MGFATIRQPEEGIGPRFGSKSLVMSLDKFPPSPALVASISVYSCIFLRSSSSLLCYSTSTLIYTTSWSIYIIFDSSFSIYKIL